LLVFGAVLVEKGPINPPPLLIIPTLPSRYTTPSSVLPEVSHRWSGHSVIDKLFGMVALCQSILEVETTVGRKWEASASSVYLSNYISIDIQSDLLSALLNKLESKNNAKSFA